MTAILAAQAPLEVLRGGAAPALAAQVAIEVLRATALAVTAAKADQLALEVLESGAPPLLTTQVAVEVLRATAITQTAAQVSQAALEAVVSNPAALRTDQTTLEVLRSAFDQVVSIRANQLVVEVLRSRRWQDALPPASTPRPGSSMGIGYLAGISYETARDTMLDPVVMPPEIAFGASGGPIYTTVVQVTADNSEQRIRCWERPLRQWQLQFGPREPERIAALEAFFLSRAGRSQGFLFRDWSEYQASNELLGYGDGGQTAFQLVIRYRAGFAASQRVITRPEPLSVVIRVDGATLAGGFWVSPSTGIVLIPEAPARGAEVRADFRFYVPARLNVDVMDINAASVAWWQASTLSVVELREAPTVETIGGGSGQSRGVFTIGALPEPPTQSHRDGSTGIFSLSGTTTVVRLEPELPDLTPYGSTAGPMFNTLIMASSSGWEQRQADWTVPRRRWLVGSGTRRGSVLKGYLGLFHVVAGRFGAFLIKDFADYSAESQVIGHGDGVTTTFQLVKSYRFGRFTVTRTINRPMPGTVAVTVGTGAGAATLPFTVDYLSGVVAFATPPHASRPILASFQFWCLARFDSDAALITIKGPVTQAWDSLPVVEVCS